MELPDTRRTTNGSQYVDVYPLIWRDFWDNGYVTMFAEDFPKGTIFNFLLNGFDAPPTDHYMRPLWNAMWDSEVRQSSAKYCTGNTPHYKYLLDYMRDFNVKYRNVSKFAFLLGAELTHDDNSKGEYMDGDLVELLTFLHSGGYLEDTLLVVMSDHGARYNAARKTVQGKMEERLPMMSLRFPPWFKQRYPILNRNLVTNVDRLSTPYDIHETLLDVLNLGRIVNTVDQPDKSISLLRPIPWNRTCTDAGIEMHWCTCMEQSPLDTRNGEVTKAVETVLGFVNSKTRKLRKLCAELQIKTVLNALLLIPNEQVTLSITQTCPCNIQRYFTAEKMLIFR